VGFTSQEVNVNQGLGGIKSHGPDGCTGSTSLGGPLLKRGGKRRMNSRETAQQHSKKK